MTNIPRISGHGTTQACAACKYQRRKCAPDCILAPYFPHNRQRQFLNAHKLFGVSNITKIIKTLEPPEKDKAMRTIIFQSDVRARDPVGGCYRIIRELQSQIENNKAELDLVLHQLAGCQAQAAQQQLNPLQIPPETDDSVFSYEIMNAAAAEPLNVQNYFYDVQPTTAHEQDQEYVNSLNVDVQNQLQVDDVNAWASGSDNYVYVKPQIVEIPYEGHKFEQDQEALAERRIVPSTRLLISS